MYPKIIEARLSCSLDTNFLISCLIKHENDGTIKFNKSLSRANNLSVSQNNVEIMVPGNH